MAEFFLGLDLGQAADYTALAVLEARPGRDAGQDAGPPPRSYAVRHLRRWPLGTKYPAIVAEVCDLVRTPPLTQPELIVDATGVGAAVVDSLADADPQARLRRALITSGHHSGFSGGAWHVAKKELVSVLQVLLQSGRLRIAPNLEHAPALQTELLQFRVKVTAAGNETFESWRERDHDDLVLAVALACWLGERQGPSVGPEGVFPLHAGPGGKLPWQL